jgi:hypothetical protein
MGSHGHSCSDRPNHRPTYRRGRQNQRRQRPYPNSTLKGKITNLSDVKFGTDGTYNAKIKGTLEMHGVTKDIEVPAVITVKDGATSFKSEIKVACADYKIAIPSVVADKIAKEVKINIEGTLKAN